jgi:hypothetical protein
VCHAPMEIEVNKWMNYDSAYAVSTDIGVGNTEARGPSGRVKGWSGMGSWYDAYRTTSCKHTATLAHSACKHTATLAHSASSCTLKAQARVRKACPQHSLLPARYRQVLT